MARFHDDRRDLIRYFKAVVYSYNRLKGESKFDDDKYLDTLRDQLIKEARELYGLDEYKSKDAVDDAYNTIKEQKRLASPNLKSIKKDIAFLASKI